MLRLLAASLAALSLTSPATSQVSVFASETFEYTVPGLVHGMGGGTGWSNNWWVSGGGNNDIVMFDASIMPPFAASDGVGGYAGQAVPFGEGYRQFDLGAAPSLFDANSNMFGADGNTLWVSFSTVNFQGQPQEHYGGLSLWRAGAMNAERLFLGSPWNSMGWGIDDEGGNGAPEVVVPGTDDTVAARLVYRIDFMPGMDRVRMFIDPSTPYPTGTPVLDEMITDLTFDEIRISSGGNNGDLYFFDAIEFAVGVPTGGLGTNFCMANANSTGATGSISASGSDAAAMNDVTLHASQLPNSAFGFFITSQMQGFVSMPAGSAGNLCLGGSIGRYVAPSQIQNSGMAGAFSLTIDLTQTPQPTSTVTILPGETWNWQAWHRDTGVLGPTSNFTDGLEITFV